MDSLNESGAHTILTTRRSTTRMRRVRKRSGVRTGRRWGSWHLFSVRDRQSESGHLGHVGALATAEVLLAHSAAGEVEDEGISTFIMHPTSRAAREKSRFVFGTDTSPVPTGTLGSAA
ncbi:hypothetical protein [Cryobacterium sp. PH29-G1]|uniref:hypothetical protein n=1 Tax=Cryobacterium sp. PH29-G1 TaxID=3046211 RepID=UPI0024BAE938|nr:hypothetical protein [Cryobacterium sp. PH29-G1]MDJ0348371.1 hypothetical protein [Cryobacterium sp. PH29-G1]